MEKILKFISGVALGFSPIFGGSILAIAIYASFPNMIGILCACTFLIGACWAGYKIFQQVQIQGPIEVLTAVHASRDLDNLEPTTNDNYKRRQPEKLVQLVKAGKHLFKGGAIRIYGDWFGEPYKSKHIIETMDYNEANSILSLNFQKGERLEVKNPRHIFEDAGYLKILDADEVTLEVKPTYFLKYQKKEKKINTFTNVNWYQPRFNVSIIQPSLMIYR